MARKKKWIQKAIFGKDNIKHDKGRVRRYLKRVYGNRAFFDNGNIKQKYIGKAIKRIKKGKGKNKQGLLNALYLAKRLKRM